MVKDSDDADVKAPLEESGNGNEEEKKENEPFAVPTAGAFYMHDDRFRDNAGARHRYLNLHSDLCIICVCVYCHVVDFMVLFCFLFFCVLKAYAWWKETVGVQG